MRIDRQAALHGLTETERYLASCWFNGVHQYSTDAFRVPAMNALSMLHELRMALTRQEASPQDRWIIVQEALDLLIHDPVLQRPIFATLQAALLRHLKSYAEFAEKRSRSKRDEAADGDGKAAEKGDKAPLARMLGYAIADLLPKVEQDYVREAFALLRAELRGAGNRTNIRQATLGLLSTLLDQEFALDSLYVAYSQQLIPRRSSPNYNFQTQFDVVERTLTRPKVAHEVTFAIDRISKPAHLPGLLNGLAISADPPFGPAPPGQYPKVLQPNKHRSFVTVCDVMGADLRSAGRVAYEQVTRVLNLLRFEYEHAPLQISEQFAARRQGKDPEEYGRPFPVPKTIPNPVVTLDGNEAADFIDGVNTLMARTAFSAEGQDRLASAFRLYRQGRDQEAIEAKLVNWWTALEYLVRGSQTGGGIGASIENAIVPVVVLGFAPKVLLTLRTFLLATASPEDAAALLGPDARRMTVAELWQTFIDPVKRAAVVEHLANEPRLAEEMSQTLNDLYDNPRLEQRLAHHDQRVRWQMQRIWRCRCDIVHSAGRDAGHVLLCANLEYYLKVTLHGLLAALKNIPALGSPAEYFERRADSYTYVLAQLKKNETTALLADLQHHP